MCEVCARTGKYCKMMWKWEVGSGVDVKMGKCKMGIGLFVGCKRNVVNECGYGWFVQ